MRIIVGHAHEQLGQDICKRLGVSPSARELGAFADGETKVRLVDDVRGMDIYIIQPTCPPVNQNLMELLIIADAAKRASAKNITAVVPYFGYARQDRKHAGRVPITARLVADLMRSAGIGRVLCMDLHAQQIQGFFDKPLDHLYARPAILKHLKNKNYDCPVLLSPDVGSAKMAKSYASRLNGQLAIIEKERKSDTEIETGHVIGQIKGRDCIIVDDMISTAGSMAAAVQIAKANGANSVTIAASHGLFCGQAWHNLKQAAPEEIVVSNTVPQTGNAKKSGSIKFSEVSVAEILAEAIIRIHHNRSVSSLFDN